MVMEWMHISGGVVALCLCEESLVEGWFEPLHHQIPELDITEQAIALEMFSNRFGIKMMPFEKESESF